ncbi:hypothetical protein AMTR_s00012p00263970 [Amborella trichopoda]|uniref:Uncharacterized protein n=1 Tax=Amborella trichopoda TaxID=13333 RepID=W1PK03_AMBTC|nr:hypothetical protein AMTR_s00012p00263970 [Amborella trichopoda]
MTILCSLSCSVIIAFFVAALSIHAAEASSGNSTNTVGVRVFLDPQNVARADVDVDVGPLVWDSRFTEFARSYDNVEEIVALTHSEGPGHWEKICFGGSGRKWNITDIHCGLVGDSEAILRSQPQCMQRT